MRRAWTRFFPCISAALALCACLAASRLAASQRESSSPPARAPLRANELTLAGLRPGRDTLSAALRRYRRSDIVPVAESADRPPASPDNVVNQWRDNCRRQSLLLESDGQSLIEEITVSALPAAGAKIDGKCDPRQSAALNSRNWTTGRGLRLGDSRQRITQLYGPPDSSGPSVRGSDQLDFLYYAFDWAGPDVPQVMEIYCDRDSGRVMEITLAFPSL